MFTKYALKILPGAQASGLLCDKASVRGWVTYIRKDGVIFSYWNILILNTFSRLYGVVFLGGNLSKKQNIFLESTSTSPIAWDTWETLPSSQWHRIHPNLKILLVFFFFRGDFQFLWGEIWRSRGGARSSASRQCQHGFGFGQGVCGSGCKKQESRRINLDEKESGRNQ